MYPLKKSMLFERDREVMSRPILVQSINTGRLWYLEDQDALNYFMRGRKPQFYNIYMR